MFGIIRGLRYSITPVTRSLSNRDLPASRSTIHNLMDWRHAEYMAALPEAETLTEDEITQFCVGLARELTRYKIPPAVLAIVLKAAQRRVRYFAQKLTRVVAEQNVLGRSLLRARADLAAANAKLQAHDVILSAAEESARQAQVARVLADNALALARTELHFAQRARDEALARVPELKYAPQSGRRLVVKREG